MDIKVSGHEYFYDITSMSMLFFPGEKTVYVKKSCAPIHIISKLIRRNSKYISITRVFYYDKVFTSQKTSDEFCDTKNLVKYTFYKACSAATGIISSWGILTGVRPSSVYMRHLQIGDNVYNTLKKDYLVSDSKIKILEEVFCSQYKFLHSDANDVSIYISIPFCPSKCTYCSFISVAAVNSNDLLNKYVNDLLKEIELKANLVHYFKLNVRSIYIGGGTPGILSNLQLENVLKCIIKSFDFSKLREFCFEIGRPDTITEQKLKILKEYGVTRLCINTQTTNDNVLNNINRTHNSTSYFESVELAKSFSFECINTDLIAGLPGESVESFCKSVDDIICTGIDNITIHTLAIKKSAKLIENKSNFSPTNDNVVKMLDYAYQKLKQCGYVPYYIYRQKNCVSNGENIGFCKPDKICVYNIYMMEDVHSIISCGAGASSKVIDGKKVDRVINVKYPMEYCREFFKTSDNTDKLYKLLGAIKNDRK